MTTKMTRTGMDRLVDELQSDFGREEIRPLLIASDRWYLKYPEGSTSEWAKAMTLESLSNLDETSTYWTFVAARIHLREVYNQQEQLRGVKVYTDFADNVARLVEHGLYTPVLT